MYTRVLFGGALALLAVPALAAPVEVTTRVLTEQRQQATDGTVSVKLVPVSRVTPGDGVVYQIDYRNTGKTPAADIVIANPVPQHLIYAGPAQGSPQPEVSVDTKTFGALSDLRVPSAGGASRAATMSDVRLVRWRVAAPVAPGAGGQFAFRAVLK